MGWLVIVISLAHLTCAQIYDSAIDLKNTTDAVEFLTFTDEQRRQVCKHINCNEYCTIRCGFEQHTVCKHRCGESSLCVKFRVQGMQDSIRLYIRNLHNHYRQLIASGKDRRGGNSHAQNMPVINYHSDLEALAYCWSQRCVEGYDGCRRLIWIPTAGQNFYKSRSQEPYANFSRAFFATAFKEWYEQITELPPGAVESFPAENITTFRHFSQMIWANSRYVGCIIVGFETRDIVYKYRIHIFCNYAPTGNVPEEPIYKFGNGCTEAIAPNTYFTALCGEFDKYIWGMPPQGIDRAMRRCINGLIMIVLLIFSGL